MESKVLANGDRIDIYEASLEYLPIVIHNHTCFKQIMLPRKRNIREESCEIFLNKYKILSLDRHWRPGEYLQELDWLVQKQKSVLDHRKDCAYQFRLYCQDPSKFLLADDNLFIHLMEDPWCFHHNFIIDCLYDFVNSYSLFYNCYIDMQYMIPILPEVDEAWRSFYPSKTYMFSDGYQSSY